MKRHTLPRFRSTTAGIQRGRWILLAAMLLLLAAPVWAQEWNVQLVDDSGNTGHQSQIVVASDGTPYITYKNTSNQLNLAWWVEDESQRGWNFHVLSDATYGAVMEVLIDDDDYLHVAWSRTSQVRYGVFDPATLTWVVPIETVSTSYYNADVDLAIRLEGSDWIPSVAFNSYGDPVRVATRDPGSGDWSEEQVSTVHANWGAPSIGVDSEGGHHVSFYESNGGNLMYAVKSAGSGTWAEQVVDIDGNVGSYSSIVIDDTDTIHIAYYDITNGDLKYATTSGR